MLLLDALFPSSFSLYHSLLWVSLAVMCWYYWRFGREIRQNYSYFPSPPGRKGAGSMLVVSHNAFPKEHIPEVLTSQHQRFGFIVNPNSGKGSGEAEWKSFLPFLEELVGPQRMVVRKTARQGDARLFARDLIETEKVDVVVSVGGDGTHNEVANGYMDAEGKGKDVKLGLLAVGTCGDLCRGLGFYRITKRQQVESLVSGNYTEADAGVLYCTPLDGVEGEVVKRFFINISSAGISGLVCAGVNQSSRHYGGALTFLLHAISATMFYKNTNVRYKMKVKNCDSTTDDSLTAALDNSTEWTDWHYEQNVYQFLACNSRYNGGGMMPAPFASVTDGWLDCTVLKNVRLLDLPMIVKLYFGRHIYHPYFVSMSRVKDVYCEVDETDQGNEILIEADGETPGKFPARWKVLPKAINLIIP